MTRADTPPPVGPRLHQMRKDQGLTLDALASLSGVSRSMLSQIERQQANPTLATIWQLAKALNIEISDFIGEGQVKQRSLIELTSACFVPEIRTEDGLCLLRILSPADAVGQLEFYHLILEPQAELASDAHAGGSKEHLMVLSGEMSVSSAETKAVVSKGSIARYPADRPHAIRNETQDTAEAILVVML